MALTINSVNDKSFACYGNVVTGFDFSIILGILQKETPKPLDSVAYVPSFPLLEKTCAHSWIQNNFWGGVPVQLGYCNGSNQKLNALEYHRDSELLIAADDVILLLAKRSEIEDGVLDTSKVKAFAVKAGTAVEIFADTLHYAPCDGKKGQGYRVVIGLPKFTNYPKTPIIETNTEDKMLSGINKWVLAHPESGEAKGGAYVGLKGVNIDLSAL